MHYSNVAASAERELTQRGLSVAAALAAYGDEIDPEVLAVLSQPVGSRERCGPRFSTVHESDNSPMSFAAQVGLGD
jgi:hypothetical protein